MENKLSAEELWAVCKTVENALRRANILTTGSGVAIDGASADIKFRLLTHDFNLAITCEGDAGQKPA